MIIRRAFLFLFTASYVFANDSVIETGLSVEAVAVDPGALRLSIPLRIAKEVNYGGYSDALSLSVMIVDGKTKFSMNLFVNWLLLLPAWGMKDWEIIYYPIMLTNFRVHGNITRHSFVYFKQVTDLFTDGVYSESSVGVGLEIKKFEVYGGGAKAVLDPFDLPNEITWRVGVSRWL